MDKFTERLESLLGPLVEKINSNRYINAIKDGFFGAMSLLIIGSFFALLANIPITGYAAFMTSIFGKGWSDFFNVPFNISMNIMTLYVVISMARSLGKTYKLNSIECITSALAGFLVLTPQLALKGASGLTGIPTENLSSKGLFVGMITAVLAVEIVRFFENHGWKIKMPDSVPANVATSFSSLIPTLMVIIIFNIIRAAFAFTSFDTVQTLIYHYLQIPLQSLGSSLPAILLLTVFEVLLWSVGIHGSSIVGNVMFPIWITATAENAKAYAAGQPLPHIFVNEFYSNFMKIGGFGATLGLAILLFFFAKSKQYKVLGRLALAPGIFQINEPLIFGMPIMLNPVMLIPFLIAPIVMALMTYVAMVTGIVPYANGTMLPWTTPPVVSGFLLSGWHGAVLNVVQIFVSMAIYYPFFKVQDNIEFQKEQEQAEAKEA